MSGRRDDEFTEYVTERMWWLRRLAYLLCQDWPRADDLVQATITRLYTHWGRAAAVEHTDGYVRTILVREYLSERRSGWARRVSLTAEPPDTPSVLGDREGSLDLRPRWPACRPGSGPRWCSASTATSTWTRPPSSSAAPQARLRARPRRGSPRCAASCSHRRAPEPPGRWPGAGPDGMEVQPHG